MLASMQKSIKEFFKSWQVRIGLLVASAPYWKHVWNLIGAWGNFKDMKELLPGIWQFLNSVFGTILFTLTGFGLVALQLRKQQRQMQSGETVKKVDGKQPPELQAVNPLAADVEKLEACIKEMEEEKTALETGRKTDADIIEEYKSKIDQLDIKRIYYETELRMLQLRYEWLHKTADEQAKDISKHVEVRDYFAIYQRSAEAIPRIYLGFDVYNKSVFDVSIELEKGYIWLDGDVSLRKPETMPPVPISLSSHGRLVIDQHLSPEQFDLIAKCENYKEGAFFYFNKLDVTIKITTLFFDKAESGRLELPQTLSSKALKNRAALELSAFQKHVKNIENITLALGSCYFAYKQIRRGQVLSQDDYQTLKDDIGRSLDICFGKEKGDEYFNQQPPFSNLLEEQDKWVDLQCKNLRELIEKEKA